MAPDPLTYSGILERAAEVAVLISLFAVGLKLGLPLSDKGWYLPVRLAIVSMTITVALIAVLGMVCLGLSFGAAVLLGAILAPTDPSAGLRCGSQRSRSFWWSVRCSRTPTFTPAPSGSRRYPNRHLTPASAARAAATQLAEGSATLVSCMRLFDGVQSFRSAGP